MLSLLQREKVRLRGFKQQLIGIGIILPPVKFAENEAGIIPKFKHNKVTEPGCQHPFFASLLAQFEFD